MISSLTPIVARRQKLSDQVYESLCNAIIEGTLAPDTRLREAQVAEALGVSRTPVRESFVRLRQQHLVVEDSAGAYFVARWDRKILWEVATLRAALEGLAISLASQNLSPDDFDYLNSIVMQMETTVQRKNFERLMTLDLQFHRYVWSHAGHQLVIEALERMGPQVRNFMAITRPGDQEGYPETHRQLIQVLRSRDPDRAEQTIRQHIRSTAELAIAKLERDSTDSASAS